MQTGNQKMKLLYLMRILLEQSDEEHPLTVAAMIAALKEYGIAAERKSIYSDLELLGLFGLDIVTRKGKTYGYSIASRQFELPELKLLVDAVQSSHFITSKKSEELIKKLASLTSIHQARQLKRQVYITERPKSINEGVYYAIDAIHCAIQEHKQLRFKYFDYDTGKNRIYRKNNQSYCQSPVALCWSDDNYYLICYSAKHNGFTHYRVDRMSDVEAADLPAEETGKQFNLAQHAKQHFGMYNGEKVQATLYFDKSLVNVVMDRFGKNVLMHAQGEGFTVCVSVSCSPVFLGWLFQFGTKARIIGPESLAEAMGQLLREGLEAYTAKEEA